MINGAVISRSKYSHTCRTHYIIEFRSSEKFSSKAPFNDTNDTKIYKTRTTEWSDVFFANKYNLIILIESETFLAYELHISWYISIEIKDHQMTLLSMICCCPYGICRNSFNNKKKQKIVEISAVMTTKSHRNRIPLTIFAILRVYKKQPLLNHIKDLERINKIHWFEKNINIQFNRLLEST